MCEHKDFYIIVLPSDDTKILEFNQCHKYDKAPFITYADLEYLMQKINECKINPENSSSKNIVEYISSGFSVSAIFKSIENKQCIQT